MSNEATKKYRSLIAESAENFVHTVLMELDSWHELETSLVRFSFEIYREHVGEPDPGIKAGVMGHVYGLITTARRTILSNLLAEGRTLDELAFLTYRKMLADEILKLAGEFREQQAEKADEAH